MDHSRCEQRYIGSGSFGEVYELIGHKPPAVIKYYHYKDSAELTRFRRECKPFQRDCKPNHGNLVQILEFEELDKEQRIRVIMEFCQRGPLKKTIFNPNVIYSMKTVVYWTKQLFDALTYMYEEHQIVHRNINSDKILVADDFSLKIGPKLSNPGPCGVNSQYSSPPVALGDRTIGEQVKVNSTPSHLNDVYSLGLVLWEIIERRIVFEEYVRNGSFRRDRFVADVTRNKLTKLEPPSCQKDLQEIVKRCTNFDRNERPTSRTILDELMHNEKLDRLVDFSPKVDESNQKILKPIDHGATFDREFQKEYGQEVSQTSKYLADDEMVKKAAKDENLLDRGAPATVSQIPNTDPFVIRFVKARILFVQPISKDGKPDFEEVMADIELPEEYKPDTKDRFYRPPKLSEDKHVYHVIASGNFADVIAAVNRDGKPVAAKRYKIEQLKQTIDGDTRLRREILISRSNRHENIVEFYGFFVEKPENPTHVCLVTERMDHTLEKYFEHLRRNDEKSEPVKRDLRHIGTLLTQLLRALDYIHRRGIMHMDVTPRNIGMNQKEFEIKLLDFKLATETNPELDHSTNVDTPYIYRSLEVFMRTKYNTGVDIWAAALVALEMLGLQLFMPTGSDEEITKKIRKRGMENAVKDRIFTVLGVPEDQYQSIFGRPIQEKPHAGEFDKIWEEKIEPRLDRDIGPLRREDFKDLIKKMLHPNLQQRLWADECLLHPFLRILNVKYQRASLLGTGKQPKDDQQMRARIAQDRDALLKELSDPRNQRIYTDEKSFP